VILLASLHGRSNPVYPRAPYSRCCSFRGRFGFILVVKCAANMVGAYGTETFDPLDFVPGGPDGLTVMASARHGPGCDLTGTGSAYV